MIENTLKISNISKINTEDIFHVLGEKWSLLIIKKLVESPSNAVPPVSELKDTSIEQDTCTYGIGSVTANTFTSECFALDVQNTS